MSAVKKGRPRHAESVAERPGSGPNASLKTVNRLESLADGVDGEAVTRMTIDETTDIRQLDNAALQQSARDHLWMHFTRMSSYDKADVPIIVKGEGAYIWDSNGKRYLAALAGLFVSQLGHGRTELGRGPRPRTAPDEPGHARRRSPPGARASPHARCGPARRQGTEPGWTSREWRRASCGQMRATPASLSAIGGRGLVAGAIAQRACVASKST